MQGYQAFLTETVRNPDSERRSDGATVRDMRTAAAHLPPGPRGHWLVGSLGELRRDRIGFYERLAREYGDVAAFRAGPYRIVLVSRPDLIEQVLVRDNRKFHKNDLLQLLRPALGDGLLLSEGDVWLRQRRLAQPAFHTDRVASYGDLMVEYTNRMVDGWRGGETRDIHRDLMALTMDIVAKVLFGADMDGRELEVGAAIEDLLEGFASTSAGLPLPHWIPTPSRRRTKRAVARLDALIASIIGARRSSPGDGDDLLGMLMAARDEDGRPMSDRQLRDEVATLFAAGHETTAVALSWTFLLLGQHPDAEAALHAELARVLGGRPPVMGDLGALPLTEGVVLESMRLYPPAWVIGRKALEDIEVGGYTIPRGTNLSMSQWVVHHDARNFERPLEFDPDRWRDGLADRLPRFAWFPFGGGQRQCIGASFAMAESRLVLATIAQHWRSRPVDPAPPGLQPMITLRPKGGLRMRVERRDP
jgi:cytochrome P450